MKKEKTQGISTETKTKDSHNTNKRTKKSELLDLRAGYCQHTSPNDATLNKSSDTLHITNSPALEYWKSELASRDPATTNLYLRSFNKFLQFSSKTADELSSSGVKNQIVLVLGCPQTSLFQEISEAIKAEFLG
jgi:hypothetical protein